MNNYLRDKHFIVQITKSRAFSDCVNIQALSDSHKVTFDIAPTICQYAEKECVLTWVAILKVKVVFKKDIASNLKIGNNVKLKKFDVPVN